MNTTFTTAPAIRATAPSKGWSIAIWAVSILLALGFGFGGFTMLTAPVAQLVAQPNGAWAATMPEGLIRFIGLSKLLGAIGLIVPAATRIRPGLTVAAALGLALVMVLAAGLHLTRGEYATIATNALLGGLALFVAWGRTVKDRRD